MNEILQHYVPQNDIGQEPVIPSKAISTFGVERLSSFDFAPDKTGDFAQDRRRPDRLFAIARMGRTLQ